MGHSTTAKPTLKLSIITVHLDDFEGLKLTLASIKPVLDRNVLEWIVIDGGSRAGKAETQLAGQVRTLASHFSSEPDEGIYDAMNKGTQLAGGDYVLYLNAGDELYPDLDAKTLLRVFADTSADMLWGHCEVRYQDDVRVPVKARSRRWAWYGMPAFHPAIFFRRAILGARPYNTSFKLAADYELVSRLLVNGATVVQRPELISVYHRGGASDVQGDVARLEESRIRLKYFRIPAFLDSGIRFLKKINARQSLFSRLIRKLRKWL